MNLHAISYTNIWPFKDTTMSIFFAIGKYLIKAPIGSGKSFLFFDGPMYGLYKYAARNMTNMQSKTWTIKLRFEINDQHYLVIRNLKKWKNKDSCSSHIFSLTIDDISKIRDQFPQTNWILDDYDFSKLLLSKWEEIVFKNETDLQQNISQLLPPREVFQSTIFLMQDADNIFELLPSERLTVLKNVFWLLGIDDAKDILAQKRREVQTELKIKSDSSSSDIKLKLLLQEYLKCHKALSNTPRFEKNFFKYNLFLKQIEAIADKVNVQEFALDDFPFTLASSLFQILEKEKSTYQKALHHHENLVKQIQEHEDNISKFTKSSEQVSLQLRVVKEKIAQIDPTKLQKLKDQKLQIADEQKKLSNQIPQTKFQTFLETHRDDRLLEKFDHIEEKDISLPQAQKIIEFCSQKGNQLKEELKTLDAQRKHFQEQKKHFQQQLDDLELKKGTQSYHLFQEKITNHEQKINSEIQSLNTEISNLTEQQKNYTDQLTKLTKKLSDFDQEVESQTIFYCEKIKTNCPFITKINKQTFAKFAEQRRSLENELSELQKTIKFKGFDKQLKLKKEKKLERQKILKTFQKTPEKILENFMQELTIKKQKLQHDLKEKNFEKQLETIAKQEKNIWNLLEQLWVFLTQVQRKTIKELHNQFQILEKEKSELEKNITNLEQVAQELEKYKLEQAKLNTQIQNLQTQTQESKKRLEILNTEQQKIIQELKQQNYEEIQQQEEIIKTFEHTLDKIKTLVEEFKITQLEVKKLQEEEKIVKNLYEIISKQLLLIVLENSLPILSDIINNFLSQVVDYQIKIFIDESSFGKIELQAHIFDDKGEREVKSLSGWQRIILKLVRMLAISSHRNSQMLFLDETINNLDSDTVGKVADMLSDFVKKHDIKLYAVTHSQQIQEMDIWDEVIEI